MQNDNPPRRYVLINVTASAGLTIVVYTYIRNLRGISLWRNETFLPLAAGYSADDIVLRKKKAEKE